MDAGLKLYEVQAVKQLDGTTLELCWPARYHRALQRLDEVTKAGDPATIQAVRKGVASIETTLRQLQAQADAAEVKAPPVCTCDWCKVSHAHHAAGAAMGNVRATLWDLLSAEGDAMPPLVQLVTTAKETESRDRLWHILKDLSDNLQAFAQAEKALGKQPTWSNAWQQ